MNVADDQSAAPAQGRPDVPPGESRYASSGQFTAAAKASFAVVTASRRLFVALRKLGVAEGRVVLAGIPLFFMGATALVAFAVSLWGCVVALIGWALMHATGSLGLALGLLVVIHLVLLGGVWSMLKAALRQAAFPRARAELRAIGQTLAHDLGRVAGATGDSARRGEPSADTVRRGAA